MNYPFYSKQQVCNILKPAIIVLIKILCLTNVIKAQVYKYIETQNSPLVLKAQGSFYVGGQSVEQTQAELGSFAPAGHITINQMYVRYMIPQKGQHNIPVVMIHGMALTGKCWETTPDGRMGWDEYFVRKGHSVYIPDQVGRGRSGFNQAVFNNVRTGAIAAGTMPPIWRFGDENAWPNFRIGPKSDTAFDGEQFPVAALGELSKQGVPDISMTLPNPNPTYKALSDLAVQLNGAVLISHSQSGPYPLEAALIAATAIKGMVLIEPGYLPAYNNEQIIKLSKLPILVVFGDNLDVATGVPGHSWKTVFENYNAFVKRINNAGGKASMFYLPEKSILGNSHMIMQDKNNLQIADIILKWMDENIGK